MKTKNVRRSAFVTLRLLVASLLCLTAGLITLFALEPHRLASMIGIQRGALRSGSAVKLDKYPAERPPAKSSKYTPNIPYSGAPRDLRPVSAVRTGKLRYMRPIDPETVKKHYYVEPILPGPPTKS